MKILVFYQYFTTPRGAWSTRIYEFARRWVAAGHEVTVVTSVYDKSDLRVRGLVGRQQIDGIDVRAINIRLANRHGFPRRVATFLAYSLLSCWYALTQPADVVLCSSGPITVGLPGLVARWLRRRRLVFELRDLWPEGAIQLGILRNRLAIRAARSFEAACYRSAHTVVALSPGQAEQIASRFDLPSLEVVPNASDNELADAARPPEEVPWSAPEAKILLYAGTIGLIDDCAQIVDLATELEQRGRDDLQIVMIGDGAERARLEQSAEERGLGNLHWLGLRPRTEVFRWLEVARVSLLTVKSVPFLATASPNKLFDAFAAGRPVLQTTQGWIKDLLEREGCGVTVRPDDIAALADAVERLADDDPFWLELCRAAHRVGRERFDRSKLANDMLGILHRATR